MSEAVYVRFDEEELEFIRNMAKEEKVTRSEAIKKLVDYASHRIKIEKAVNRYKEGRDTIRECAELAGLSYFEFFELLSKENLIGTSPDNIELHLSNLKKDWENDANEKWNNV